ncbi:hypothetical protein Bca4012_055025 [Brassica carinata]|uniref:GOLD domain-containing protein n=1 Tax=Brassica carinata TaxID=52824 RepID=A0A8X8B1Z0_BRACI|nr:hypothetical protein Bca52824_012001 [Brassica carinata]
MVLRSKNICTFLLTIAILSHVSRSLHFELKSGQSKCISEDIKSNAMTVGKYTVVNPNEPHPFPQSHKINTRVTSSHGNTYHHAEEVDSGQFSFTAVEGGDYSACFAASDHKSDVTLSIDLEWGTGVHYKSLGSLAKKSRVEVMEFEVKALIETVNSIHDEMFYLRDREEEMQDLNRATNSKMAWLSLVSLFVCLGVAGMQFMHLKTFFEKKKVI